MHAPVMLSGHFDVVAPEPDDSQFEPAHGRRLPVGARRGGYEDGRGHLPGLVQGHAFRQGPPYPPVNLLLVGNEENGETEPMGTPHVLRAAAEDDERLDDGQPYQPALLIAGERTGERGDELWGEICTQNRGVMRFDVVGARRARPFRRTGGEPSARPDRAPARGPRRG